MGVGKVVRSKQPEGYINVISTLMSVMEYHVAVGSGSMVSHPIVHFPHQAGGTLPQAAVEEEITDTPLRKMPPTPDLQNQGTARVPRPRDMPRLSFEVTSEDGFYCRADTMEGEWDFFKKKKSLAHLKLQVAGFQLLFSSFETHG